MLSASGEILMELVSRCRHDEFAYLASTLLLGPFHVYVVFFLWVFYSYYETINSHTHTDTITSWRTWRNPWRRTRCHPQVPARWISCHIYFTRHESVVRDSWRNDTTFESFESAHFNLSRSCSFFVRIWSKMCIPWMIFSNVPSSFSGVRSVPRLIILPLE